MGINVFSCFDGMSCGQIALNRAGVKYNNYYASEIDKYAIQVTQHNYPNTIQLGDVTKVSGCDLPKIGLLIGGSPCQGFSLAGKMLNFDDPRSKLFFEYVRILGEVREKNPNVKFLLENVRMAKWCQDVISRYLGVEPVKINSNLVSAQNRERYYWTNIDFDTNIKDKGITLRDIAEKSVGEKYYLNDKQVKYITDGIRLRKKLTSVNPKRVQAILAGYNRLNGSFLAVNCRGDISNEKTSTLVSTYYKGVEAYGSRPFIYDGIRFRKLTPAECERLQTVPDGYTAIVSDSQAYKMLGNGWTIDVIAHVFQDLSNKENTNRRVNLSLFDTPSLKESLTLQL